MTSPAPYFYPLCGSKNNGRPKKKEYEQQNFRDSEVIGEHPVECFHFAAGKSGH